MLLQCLKKNFRSLRNLATGDLKKNCWPFFFLFQNKSNEPSLIRRIHDLKPQKCKQEARIKNEEMISNLNKPRATSRKS